MTCQVNRQKIIFKLKMRSAYQIFGTTNGKIFLLRSLLYSVLFVQQSHLDSSILDVPLSRHFIVSFSWLRLDHNRLLARSYRLTLNDYPHSTRRIVPLQCDSQHLLINCSSLSAKSISLRSCFFYSQNPIF